MAVSFLSQTAATLLIGSDRLDTAEQPNSKGEAGVREGQVSGCSLGFGWFMGALRCALHAAFRARLTKACLRMISKRSTWLAARASPGPGILLNATGISAPGAAWKWR